MGKAVSKRLRRVVDELLEKYPDLFKPDFEHNKKVLDALGVRPSKYVRNVIAGRITRVLKKQGQSA
ncbi:MAG: small subunit ribosomal protein S17e [Candidatus Diapherotrites archaeon]|nr:small subunit ribosomal protein S17e [Candidatus Diapherotrites archaeon]MDN5366710.1 small subunit ribosomal protein S17e [Candidatus Diapherotrites archaeon]